MILDAKVEATRILNSASVDNLCKSQVTILIKTLDIMLDIQANVNLSLTLEHLGFPEEVRYLGGARKGGARLPFPLLKRESFLRGYNLGIDLLNSALQIPIKPGVGLETLHRGTFLHWFLSDSHRVRLDLILVYIVDIRSFHIHIQ